MEIKIEKYIEKYVFDTQVGENKDLEPTKKERLQYAKEQVKDIFINVWKLCFIRSWNRYIYS